MLDQSHVTDHGGRVTQEANMRRTKSRVSIAARGCQSEVVLVELKTFDQMSTGFRLDEKRLAKPANGLLSR